MIMQSLTLKLSLPSITHQHQYQKPHKRIANSELLNSRLINSLNSGNLRDAISTLDLMSLRRTHPDLPTFSLLLNSCIRSRRFDLGELVHAHLSASRLDLDSLTLNSLLSLYSKNGKWERAEAIFDAMSEKRNLVSWTSMVSCYASNGLGYEALDVFVEMLDRGFCPNEYCFSAVIRACLDVMDFRVGNAVFGSVMKNGCFVSDLCVGCALIDMFAKGFGDLENARKVFDRMPERNAVAWTLMITRFVQLGFAKEALEMFFDMVSSEIVPDRFTFTAVLSGCTELGSLSLGKQLHSQAVRFGVNLDRFVGCCLVDMYAKCEGNDSMDDSRKVFDQMPDRNVLSWTAIINGYIQIGGRYLEAIELFRQMMISGHVQPNDFTFSSVFKAIANLSDLCLGKQVHSLVTKLGLGSLNLVGNSLITMYALCGQMEDSRRAFDMLFDKNSVSYTAIIDAYAKTFDSEQAFDLFRESDDMGFEASDFAFSSLLSVAASVGAISKGEQLHARILKSGFESHQSVINALVSMYSTCGDIEAGFQVFQKMENRNVVSWTAMITGFSKHGYAEKALTLFEQLVGESNLKPNELTYTAVLSACSHAGLVLEGMKHYNEMYPKHGIVPRMEHCACMVDLLGRSGRLSEALEFINSMPIEPEVIIWRTFLGSCRVHGDSELGKYAANMILRQNPNDPAAYVLLANLLASVNQWDKVSEIRKEMKERMLIKEAGLSWLEVGNKVHKFHVGDTSHPRASEIYDELNRLVLRIKELGYVPNTDYVLHDVGLEQKEVYLCQHSEKIAVAFGLISTLESKPIRVFKNLRICGDCHAAIKYISLECGREIVVRDSNRFHHFKSGTCSCNDYW